MMSLLAGPVLAGTYSIKTLVDIGLAPPSAIDDLGASTQIASFPVGTAYALYALYVCWGDPKSSAEFDRAVKPKIS